MEIVVNWLVQGTALGIAGAAGLRLIPRSSARARSGVVWAAYLALVMLPLPALLPASTREPAGVAAPVRSAAPVSMPAGWWTSGTVALGLWLAWFGGQLIVLGRAAVAANDVKRRSEACTDDRLASLPNWPRVSLTGRATRVVLSDRVRAAGVVGCGAPVIVLAPRLIDRLEPADLDRVLVHEWAHVQRRDDVTQVAQLLVRALAGWHPAAWWLERQLELEREVACDEIAVRETGSARHYAECLVTVAAVQVETGGGLPVLAAGSRSGLHHRVARVMEVPAGSPPWRAVAFAGAATMAVCALAIAQVQVVAAAAAAAVIDVSGAGEPAVLPTAALQPFAAPAVLPPPQTRARRPGLAPARAGSAPAAPEATGPTPVEASPVPPLERPSTPGWLKPVAGTYADAGEPMTAVVLLAGAHESPADDSKGWLRAADVGVSIGRASSTAGVATAGFFRRFGQKVAGAF